MVIVETIGRIRRDHLVKGKSIREIARDLKLSRNTARQAPYLGTERAALPNQPLIVLGNRFHRGRVF
jgi:hypothetical protein